MLPKVSPPSLLFRRGALSTLLVLIATGTVRFGFNRAVQLVPQSTAWMVMTPSPWRTNSLAGGPGVVIRLAGGDDTVTIRCKLQCRQPQLYAGTGNDTIATGGGVDPEHQ